MVVTCDICKFAVNEISFDDVHGAMNSPSTMYAFMCNECRAVNNAHWRLSSIAMRVEMEISMMKRAFRRIKNGTH